MFSKIRANQILNNYKFVKFLNILNTSKKLSNFEFSLNKILIFITLFTRSVLSVSFILLFDHKFVRGQISYFKSAPSRYTPSACFFFNRFDYNFVKPTSLHICVHVLYQSRTDRRLRCTLYSVLCFVHVLRVSGNNF